MASPLKESSSETAESDPLKAFLNRHRADLKITNANQLLSLHNRLAGGDLDCDDLLKLNAESIRASLSECGLKAIEAGRILKVLLKDPASYVYQESRMHSKIIVISEEEDLALDKMKKVPTQVQAELDALIALIDGVEAQSKYYAVAINETCDKMLKHVEQQRNDLRTGLAALTQHKQQGLSTKRTQLTGLKQRVVEFLAQSQQVLHDTELEKALRKKTIMTPSENLLAEVRNITLSRHFDVDLKVLNRDVRQGDISGYFTKIDMTHLDGPPPPTLSVSDIEKTSANVHVAKPAAHGTVYSGTQVARG